MRRTPGRPRRRTRLARALGLDRNPLRRASDRAEAWIRIALLAVFLIAGPIAALSVGGIGVSRGDHRGLGAGRPGRPRQRDRAPARPGPQLRGPGRRGQPLPGRGPEHRHVPPCQ